MFPKPIGTHRGSIGTFTGTVSLLEDSNGKCFFVDGTSIANADPANSDVYELNEGSGFVERSLGYIATANYAVGHQVRKRIYNSYFDAYSSYITGTASVTDTGGATAYSAFLNGLGAITINAYSGPSAGTTDIQLNVPAGMIGYTVYVNVYGDMSDYGAPFGNYSYNVSSDTEITGTTQNIALTYNPPGGSGSYFGNYTIEIYLRYAYPDGPYAQSTPITDSGTF
jgi:hypothetical protein